MFLNFTLFPTNLRFWLEPDGGVGLDVWQFFRRVLLREPVGGVGAVGLVTWRRSLRRLLAGQFDVLLEPHAGRRRHQRGQLDHTAAAVARHHVLRRTVLLLRLMVLVAALRHPAGAQNLQVHFQHTHLACANKCHKKVINC